jgi:hypothetical protein
MTGFILQVDNKYISGAIKDGITSILLTLKEDRFRLYFGSLDKSGMLSYIWYATDSKIGDRLKISFTNIISLSVKFFGKLLAEPKCFGLGTVRFI